MAVNQNQVDHIIAAASEDGSEVKLQNLEREVDLIKTSIKRLLMDIRERMNERENPFTIAAPSSAGNTGGNNVPVSTSTEETRKNAPEGREAAPDARKPTMGAGPDNSVAGVQKPQPLVKPEPPIPTGQVPVQEAVPSSEERRFLDDQVLSLFKTQAPAPAHKLNVNHSLPFANEKIRLQKVYKLFKWTSMAIQKFGHDRLEIILESYRIMGYISKEACDEIKEISRLMPANLGEEHEVGPDEFVSGLLLPTTPPLTGT